ncbi:TlpA family protein disulfide reductase [bacterium]|nr:TlpA family protein disulfide reductase [bacterium]
MLAFGSAGLLFIREYTKSEKTPEEAKKEVERIEDLAGISNAEKPVSSGKDSSEYQLEEPKKIEKKKQDALDCKKAPDFVLRDTDGKKFRLSDHSGKIIILDFWTTWCAPCKIEIPSFIKLQQSYGRDGLLVVGVSLDERHTKHKVKPFVDRMNINYPVLLDGKQMSFLYGSIQSIPTTFIIDQRGCIRGKLVGLRQYEEFENWVRKLLSEG